MHFYFNSHVAYINRESVLDIPFYASFIGLVDLLWLDDFDIAEDFLFSAEIKHLLSLFDAADQRTDKLFSSKDYVESAELNRLRWCSDQYVFAVYV